MFLHYIVAYTFEIVFEELGGMAERLGVGGGGKARGRKKKDFERAVPNKPYGFCGR